MKLKAVTDSMQEMLKHRPDIVSIPDFIRVWLSQLLVRFTELRFLVVLRAHASER